MTDEWVEVHASPQSAGFMDGVALLRDAGITCRIERDDRPVHYHGRDLDPDRIFVHTDDAPRAAEILGAWDRESDQRVRRHMSRIGPDFAMLLCLISSIAGTVVAIQGETTAAIVFAMVFLATLPASWKRLREMVRPV